MVNVTYIIRELNTVPKPVTNNFSYSWTLREKIIVSLSPSEIEIQASKSPNASAILNPLRTTPNLTTYSVEIMDIKSQALDQANGKIFNSSSRSFFSFNDY